MLVILLWLNTLRWILKLLNLRLIIDLKLIGIRIVLLKVTLKIGQEKHLLMIAC